MLDRLMAIFQGKIKSEPETPVMLTRPSNVSDGTHLNPDWDYMWETCRIDAHRLREVNQVAETIRANLHRYGQVMNATGVPWELIGAIHYRESSLRFTGCLHNGDRLPGPTRNVPKGRGPFASWEDSAIDAFKLVGFHKIKFEGYVSCLVAAEMFNGRGYRRRGEYSPYVWAGTNWSDERGKFVADGKFNKEAPEKQLGVAAILKALSLEASASSSHPS